MIISINGTEGSGKTTIADKIAHELNYPKYSMGKIFRQIADNKRITLSELHKLCEKDPQVDRETDEYLVVLSKKEKDFVIESRTAWYFIDDSLKIYLKVDEKEAARRIFKQINSSSERESEDKNLNSVEKVLVSEKKRKAGDDKRYQKYYKIDIHNEKNYDFILDTTNLTISEVFDKVMEFIRKNPR